MKTVIENFYNSFKNLDADGMIACYHDDIIFEDSAFGVLERERAKAMWQMLCTSQKGKDFRVLFSEVEASNYGGSAHWEAFYTFTKTGRKVHNIIEASFEFKDGLIFRHKDEFNLHKWAKQAMGIKGIFFGGMQFFKNKLQNQTNFLLDKFIEEKSHLSN